jgi:hypothetical protein
VCLAQNMYQYRVLIFLYFCSKKLPFAEGVLHQVQRIFANSRVKIILNKTAMAQVYFPLQHFSCRKYGENKNPNESRSNRDCKQDKYIGMQKWKIEL